LTLTLTEARFIDGEKIRGGVKPCLAGVGELEKREISTNASEVEILGGNLNQKNHERFLKGGGGETPIGEYAMGRKSHRQKNISYSVTTSGSAYPLGKNYLEGAKPTIRKDIAREAGEKGKGENQNKRLEERAG